MTASTWLAAIGWLFLYVSLPAFVLCARGAFRAGRRLRKSPDDALARFENGWLGSFTLSSGLASCLSIGLILHAQAGRSGLAKAGMILINLLLQPAGLMIAWMGFRNTISAMFGRIIYAGQRIPESELAELREMMGRALLPFCMFRGFIAFVFGAAISVSCGVLLIDVLSR